MSASKLTQRQLRALGCRQDPKTDRYRAPSDTTFFRVLNGLDAAEFDLRMGQWMMAQEISILQGLAVDGKCLRGSARTDGKPLQLLSAVSHRLRLTVAQEPIEEKSNEIPALKPLLQQAAQRGAGRQPDHAPMPCIASRRAPASSLRNWGPIISWASKAIKAAFWSGRKSSCPKRFFSR